MSSTVVFNAEMVCDGCSGAIERILKKVEGIDKVEIDMEGQKVTATGSNLDADAMLAKLEKWGKSANKKVSIAN